MAPQVTLKELAFHLVGLSCTMIVLTIFIYNQYRAYMQMHLYQVKMANLVCSGFQIAMGCRSGCTQLELWISHNER